MLPMRMRSEPQARTTARLRRLKKFGDSVNIYQTIQDHEWNEDSTIWTLVDNLHAKYTTGINAPLGGRAARFDGYFYVSRDKQGAWTFTGANDDRIAVDVDGFRLLAASGSTSQSGTITLKPGWHRYVIRTADGTPDGNTTYGTGGYLTDSHGNVTALEVSVNGGAYESFDERYVPLALQPGEAQKIEKPGLSEVTTVAKNATLTNDTDEGGYCPINGTLTGEGTLAGPFRFAGDKNCWKVEGTFNRKELKKIAFENADAQTLAGLKRVEAVFDEEPALRRYPLGPALGVTDASSIELGCTDVSGKDWSEKMSLVLEGGQLYLQNARPKGLVIFFQ